jgi:hypothetical protein
VEAHQDRPLLGVDGDRSEQPVHAVADWQRIANACLVEDYEAAEQDPCSNNVHHKLPRFGNIELGEREPLANILNLGWPLFLLRLA